MRHGLTGWRYGAFIGCFVGLVGLHTYFTILSPMMDPEPYRQIREQVEGKYPDRKV